MTDERQPISDGTTIGAVIAERDCYEAALREIAKADGAMAMRSIASAALDAVYRGGVGHG